MILTLCSNGFNVGNCKRGNESISCVTEKDLWSVKFDINQPRLENGCILSTLSVHFSLVKKEIAPYCCAACAAPTLVKASPSIFWRDKMFQVFFCKVWSFCENIRKSFKVSWARSEKILFVAIVNSDWNEKKSQI